MTTRGKVKPGAFVDELTSVILLELKAAEAARGKQVVGFLKTRLVSLKQAYDLAVHGNEFEVLPSLTADLSALLHEVKGLAREDGVASLRGVDVQRKLLVHTPETQRRTAWTTVKTPQTKTPCTSRTR